MTRHLVCLATLAVLIAPAPALAHVPAGSGGSAYAQPAVSALQCATGDDASCPPGVILRLSGENLAGTQAVIFLGGRGPRDDRRARPQSASPHRVVVTVPASARSGRLRVLAADAAAAGPLLQIVPLPVVQPPAAPSPPLAGAFPVQGAHDYGSETNRFGAARGHEGQDILAACGTPLVAALTGTITLTSFQERAGNYVVVKADDGTSQAYMHMLAPAIASKGQRINAGEPLGQVGQSGRASACHLHFELWTAPGWSEGGVAIDPLALLQSLETPS